MIMRYTEDCHLSGVVVGVLTTRPKNRGFKPSRGDGFLRVIKIRSTLSFEQEGKLEVPCRKILWHVEHPLRYFRLKRQNSHFFVHSCYLPQMSLLVGLPESSGGQVRSYTQPASSSPWLFMLTYHLGDEQ
jgi:hypothetical protein